MNASANAKARLQSGSPGSLVLREATEDDAADIAGVVRAAFAEYDGMLDPPSGAHDETADAIRHKLRTEHGAVALLDGKIVGCVLYAVEPGHLYSGRLSVLPGFRNRGLARALENYVERRAAAMGFRRVQLGVRVDLPRLRAHYERHGYRVIEERRHDGYPEPTYLQMEKRL